MEDPLDILDEFLDKKSNKTFTYKNITYELIYKNSKFLFRRQDQPTCFIDFELDYEPIRNEINEIIRYKYFIFIYKFQCNFVGKNKGDGLKLLIAFVNYINQRIKELNETNPNFEIETIKLTAEPYNPNSNIPKRITNDDLKKLVAYYRSIGFKFIDPENRKYLTELKSVDMEANFEDLLHKYPKVSSNSTKKYKKIKSKSKSSKSSRSSKSKSK